MRLCSLTLAVLLALFALAPRRNQDRPDGFGDGADSAIGIPQKNTGRIAAEDGGQRPIEYFQLEDGGDTTRAVQNAKKLIGEDN